MTEVYGCQECPVVAENLADAEEHADQTGHMLVRGDVVELERVGPVVADALSAPEVAILRMAIVLESTGAEVTDAYLVDRTIAARGILLNHGNRTRYALVLANLVGAGLLRTERVGELSPWADERITTTRRGRRALQQQNGWNR